MQKSVRYYIQTSGEQPTVRSVAVDKPAESAVSSTRAETLSQTPRPGMTEATAASGVRRIRAAIKRGGV